MHAYTASRFARQRRPSLPVTIGDLRIGGDAPLCVQSMCTTPTTDVAATVAQSIALAAVGCELVRVTAPGVKDAEALKDIRQQFSAAGYAHIPLCADIHFMPKAAMIAVEHVEKVRINPGNFADKKSFAVREYSDTEYNAELERIAERFTPLVKRARALGRCLRIGSNHGSLSDRIMNRYGDTPAGMVESAMEFICIAEDLGFHDMVVSMKSSNPKVMIQAYRLLAARLSTHGRNYPLHLGVTEAGDGEDARVKSACGIGALLEDGIGDTIRVSLTEDPCAEIPVAQALRDLYQKPDESLHPQLSDLDDGINPYSYQRRDCERIEINGHPVGGDAAPLVIAAAQSGTQAPDLSRDTAADHMILLDVHDDEPYRSLRTQLEQLRAPLLAGLRSCGSLSWVAAYRLLHTAIRDSQQQHNTPLHPIVLSIVGADDLLKISATVGALLADGIGDALYLPDCPQSCQRCFTLLQSMKARMTRADYVACPSCGRTLFDLMEVTAEIKAVTDHLDDVTIAIMGCIVNGPGEMADADFGYVGSGPGKITLYRGKEAVITNIPTAEARERLIELIKASGKWREQSETQC